VPDAIAFARLMRRKAWRRQADLGIPVRVAGGGFDRTRISSDAQTLRTQAKRVEIDAGVREGVTTTEAQGVKTFEVILPIAMSL